MSAVMQAFAGAAMFSGNDQLAMSLAIGNAIKQANAYLKDRGLRMADVQWTSQTNYNHQRLSYVHTITILHDGGDVAES